VVDFIHHWHEREFNKGGLIRGLGIGMSKFYSWCERYGKDNNHNGKIPRDYWLQEWEKEKIIEFYREHPTEGYRRVSYLMLDQGLVAVSPATTYRVLANAGLLKRWNDTKTTSKGKGFAQPLKPHEHWHIDVSYLNICGTFYYFIGILDGCSRYVVHWDIRESMTKEFIRVSGMTHVRTSPHYPQSNGKLERFHRTIKHECIRPNTPVSLEDAKRIVKEFIETYNNERLHSALGYIAPVDKLNGKAEEIFKARDAKLEAARSARKMEREAQFALALMESNRSVTKLAANN
jgi:transposase InsO family protein